MRLETLFEKFDRFADAPDAVGKMRGLILRLAMNGALSKPRSSDVSIENLLREVEKEKKTLGIRSSAKTASGGHDICGNESANTIPSRWRWVRFGDIARHNAGKTLDKGRNRGELRDYVTTSNLYWGFFQLGSVRQMPILDDELERCTAIKGDLLICEGGEAGRAAVWPYDHEISFQNHVHRARFFAGIDPHFVQRYFEKLNATGEIDKYRKGVGISNMSGKSLASIPIPLPPLAEQRRIVAKVDELMALCDRLEAQQQERDTRHAALARASLARFADAPTPANLNFLFHKSYDIAPADLRKSILTLAVQGKLVPGVETKNVSLGEVIELISGQHLLAHEQNEERKGVPYLTGPSDFGARHPIPTRWTETPKVVAEPGDILVTVKGSGVGKTNKLVGERTAISRQVMAVRVTGAHPDFVHLVLMNAAEHFQDSMTGIAIPGIGRKDVLGLKAELPPLVEQRRIVAKVDQLMALVDELETQLAASRATAKDLLDALVSELTASSRN